MKTITVSTLLLLTLFFAPCAQAGLFGDFLDAIGKTVEDYNNDMLATGDAVNASLKDGKVMEAFTSYEQNIQVVGDNALANSKAVYSALKEIVMWLPNQIKKIWDKFVEVLQKIRDALAALNQPGGGIIPPEGGGGAAKASQISRSSRGWMDNFDFNPVDDGASDDNSGSNGSNGTSDSNGSLDFDTAELKGLGDGWVELFESHDKLSDKLETFTQYRGHCHTMGLWMKGLENKHLSALEPKFAKVNNECSIIEDSLFDEISESLEGNGKKFEEYTKFLDGLDKDEAKLLLGDLTKKLTQRMNMVELNRSSEISLEDVKTNFNNVKDKVGLR